jgi:hypothetical protein
VAPHRGILIRKNNGKLYFRHATAGRAMVVEDLFVDYVHAQPEHVGVNLLFPRPKVLHRMYEAGTP